MSLTIFVPSDIQLLACPSTLIASTRSSVNKPHYESLNRTSPSLQTCAARLISASCCNFSVLFAQFYYLHRVFSRKSMWNFSPLEVEHTSDLLRKSQPPCPVCGTKWSPAPHELTDASCSVCVARVEVWQHASNLPEATLDERLYTAASAHDLPAVRALLAKGANPDFRWKNVPTQLVPLLMPYKEIEDEHSHSLAGMHSSASTAPTDDAKRGSDYRDFKCAAFNVVKCLLDHGANVNPPLQPFGDSAGDFPDPSERSALEAAIAHCPANNDDEAHSASLLRFLRMLVARGAIAQLAVPKYQAPTLGPRFACSSSF